MTRKFFLQVFFFLLFTIFSLAFFTPSFSAYDCGTSQWGRLCTDPVLSVLHSFDDSEDPKVLKLIGTYTGGTDVYVCPTEGPFDTSYAFTVESNGYSIASTTLTGTFILSLTAAGPGHSGICADYLEWSYTLNKDVNISSLDAGDYSMRVRFVNSNDQESIQDIAFTVKRPGSTTPPPPPPDTPTCTITAFTASPSSVASGAGATLTFAVTITAGTPVPARTISVLAPDTGAVTPTELTNTTTGGTYSTGNLTKDHIYRLTCGSATSDLTVPIASSTPPPSCTNDATNYPTCTTCPTGQTMENDICVCPTGKVKVNGACVTPTCTNDATNYPTCTTCPTDQTMENGACVCPTGKVKVDGACVTPTCTNGANNPPDCDTCPTGKVMTNGICVTMPSICDNGATNYPTCTTCPTDQTMENGACVCPTGKVMTNGVCVTPPPPTDCTNGATNPPDCDVCPPGKVMTNGVCVTPPPPACTNGATNYPTCTTCPLDQTIEDGTCVCPAGKEKVDGVCVTTPPPACTNGATNPPTCTTCPTGKVMTNGVCVIPPPSNCGDLVGDHASFISQSVPSSMTTGSSLNVSVKMKNCGNSPWNSGQGYKLGSQNTQDNIRWGMSRVALPHAVTAGSEVIFSFNITAPVSAGDYNFQWRMVKEGVHWFGDTTLNKVITVTTATCQNGATNPPTCTIFPPCANGATNPPTCSLDGSWGAWSACSETLCGRTGTQTRVCTPPQNGGTPCSEIDGGNSSRACNTAPCPSGWITATSCTIPGDASWCITPLDSSCQVTKEKWASTCNSFVSWGTQNLTPASTEVTRNNPKNTSVSTNTSGTNVSVTVNYNATNFYLYHNLYSLAQANVNASCSAGTIWDGIKCKTVGGLSGTLVPTNGLYTCNIEAGESACVENPINFSWNVLNALPDSVSAVTRNPNNTIVGTGHTGTGVPFVVKHGVETFFLYNSKSAQELARSTVAGVCAPGTAWDSGIQKCRTIDPLLCSNGVINVGEECDDGEYNGQCPSTCSSVCTIRSCAAPGDVNINVLPGIIFAESPATLVWSWDGEESCTGTNFDDGGASPGTSPISPSGSVVVRPISTTTYTIRCGLEIAQTTLVVKKKPTFKEE